MDQQKKLSNDADADKAKILNKIGNILHPDVVVSKNEDDNKVIRTWGTVNKEHIVDGSAMGKLHHHEVMQCLDMVEFERGQKVAGHRGYFLKNYGVLLN